MKTYIITKFVRGTYFPPHRLQHFSVTPVLNLAMSSLLRSLQIVGHANWEL